MITPAQREARRQFICASDACAILFGHDGFKSREDVWAEKVYGLDAPDEPNAAQSLGNRLEPVIIDWTREMLAPARIDSESPEWVHPCGWLMAHPDGIVMPNGSLADAEPLEVKYRSADSGWGESGTANIPDPIAVQLYVQMLCKGAACGHVAAWLAGRFGIDPRLYRVELDEQVGKRIFDELDLFWHRYVENRKTPPKSEAGPSLDVMKSLRRVPDAVVRIDTGVAERFIAARDARLAAEKAERTAQAELLMHMGGADAAQCDGGIVIHNKLITVNHKPKEAFTSSYRKLDVRRAE